MSSIKQLVIRIIRKVGLIFLPLRKRLPFRYGIHLHEAHCENELRHLSRISNGHGTAVDVGANEGLYSFALSTRFAKVYSFEINDDLTKELAAYNRGNIEIINQGLSSQAGGATLYIPILKDRPLVGWASLSRGNYPGTQEHIEKSVVICLLDTFDLQDVSFIKIDTEGHELEVLKGAAKTIARNRPVILVEVRPENMNAISDFFATLDYQKQTLDDVIGIKGSEGNYIFMPREHSHVT